MGKLILLRHGQSAWNKENVFTGWVDIPLSKQGIKESIEAGKKIKDIPIDMIFTSCLSRAEMTAFLAMTESSFGSVPCVQHNENEPLFEWYQRGGTGHSLIPLYKAMELNERMYGDLQGYNKDEVRLEHGKELVQLWRRSFDARPPRGENLADTAGRTLPFFSKKIEPEVAKGKNVLISAHGNSLRAIVMRLENLSEEEVLHLEIATGEVKIYEYRDGEFLSHE